MKFGIALVALLPCIAAVPFQGGAVEAAGEKVARQTASGPAGLPLGNVPGLGATPASAISDYQTAVRMWEVLLSDNDVFADNAAPTVTSRDDGSQLSSSDKQALALLVNSLIQMAKNDDVKEYFNGPGATALGARQAGAADAVESILLEILNAVLGLLGLPTIPGLGSVTAPGSNITLPSIPSAVPSLPAIPSALPSLPAAVGGVTSGILPRDSNDELVARQASGLAGILIALVNAIAEILVGPGSNTPQNTGNVTTPGVSIISGGSGAGAAAGTTPSTGGASSPLSGVLP